MKKWLLVVIAIVFVGVLGAGLNLFVVSGSVNGPDFSGGEEAPYEIKGGVVYVNNAICAVSHSKIAREDRGKYTNRVTYNGPAKKFSGKTLVFNQCCPACVERFAQFWKKYQQQIMDYHGLT